MTWSNLPDPYDDCVTAGTGDRGGNVTLSFGSYQAHAIESGRRYYGQWTFKHLSSSYFPTFRPQQTSIRLLGQEGAFKPSNPYERAVCPIVEKSQWCTFGIDEHRKELLTTTWVRGVGQRRQYGMP